MAEPRALPLTSADLAWLPIGPRTWLLVTLDGKPYVGAIFEAEDATEV